jgi:hypothetical protein
MDRTTQGGEYKGINTAWTEVGQKRKRFSIEDEARRVATGGWALPERVGAVGSARVTIDPSSSYLSVAGG